MERPKKETLTRTDGLVEMNWDPITRIIGSLGVYTKIDFKNKEVAECHMYLGNGKALETRHSPMFGLIGKQ